jgi:segregation and condensation protein B
MTSGDDKNEDSGASLQDQESAHSVTVVESDLPPFESSADLEDGPGAPWGPLEDGEDVSRAHPNELVEATEGLPKLRLVPPETLGDMDTTVNLAGDFDFDALLHPGTSVSAALESIDEESPWQAPSGAASDDASSEPNNQHLKGVLEALIFASESSTKPAELAKASGYSTADVKLALVELRDDYMDRGVQLDEVAGGWLFRTNPKYGSFVREVSQLKPVKLTRAQVETLAILAYRQPITRPEIDDIRGVDSGPVLKLLLERNLIRILGKKDEPGRPMLYGTTNDFLHFFGLKSLRELPTLREFTELTEDSRRIVQRELGDVLPPTTEPRQELYGEESQLGEASDHEVRVPAEGQHFTDASSGGSSGNEVGTEGDGHGNLQEEVVDLEVTISDPGQQAENWDSPDTNSD